MNQRTPNTAASTIIPRRLRRTIPLAILTCIMTGIGCVFAVGALMPGTHNYHYQSGGPLILLVLALYTLGSANLAVMYSAWVLKTPWVLALNQREFHIYSSPWREHIVFWNEVHKVIVPVSRGGWTAIYGRRPPINITVILRPEAYNNHGGKQQVNVVVPLYLTAIGSSELVALIEQFCIAEIVNDFQSTIQ